VTVRIINADVMDGLAQLADESVHCVVTSPPYWGLRDYGAEGQIGLEPTLAEHIDKLVQVFREVRRVLRKDGTLWLNYGDGYAGTGKSGGGEDGERRGVNGYGGPARQGKGTWQPPPPGLKPKDLLMMPERLALALQADGWWVRARIIWHKPNPMPESVTDRPTKSHEHIWLLTKSPRYFFDAEAVREPDSGQDHPRSVLHKPEPSGGLLAPHDGIRTAEGRNGMGRNIRDVWTLNTEPFDGEFCTACGRYYDGAEKRQIRVKDGKRYCRCGQHDAWLSHFAVFPSELVEKCILAGTSEKGCCAECGAPWVRVTGRACKACGELIPTQAKSCGSCGHVNDWKSERGLSDAYGTTDFSTPGKATPRKLNASGKQATIGHSNTETTGWRPSCTCNADVVPCTVLDPFFGSGTTGLVADRLQRHAIGIELNPEYAAMAEKRIAREAGLFAEIRAESVTPAGMTT